MNEQPDIETFVGDESPDITFTIVRGTAPVDLTSALSVNFLLFNPVTKVQTNVAGEACIVSDAINGKCIYSWGPNDKPYAGVYRGYVQVEFPGSKPETSAVRVNVQKIGF